MSDISLPLPPTPGADDRPHVYVLNSDEDFLELIAGLLADVRLRISLEQLRPNLEVTVQHLRSARPDLLVLDVVPYRDDARQLLERIADDAALRELPVMLASTSANVAERLAEVYSAQVWAVLPKPFDLDDLFVMLRRLIARKGTRLNF